MPAIRLRTALAAAAVSCALMAAAPPSQAETVLKVVPNSDLKILDPTWSTAYIVIRHSYLNYDTLFALNSKFEPKPELVDSYSASPDAMTYTFTLRPNIKFSDGTPIRAADAVASLKRWALRSPMGQHLVTAMGGPGGFEVVDDRTFKITLQHPFGLVIEAMAEVPTFVFPERIASGPPDQQITDTVGSGPFMFRKDLWQPGSKAIYDKNPYYVPRNEPPDYLSGGKVAKVDRVEWDYMPDNNTALAALQSGEIDYFEAPPLDFMPLMTSNPDIRVKDIELVGVQMIVRPNSLYPPFNNYKARQALLYMINQNDVMQAVAGDPSIYMAHCAAYFMCHSANESGAGAGPYVKQDFARAKALLAEAGYKGEPIVVLQPTDRAQYAAATTVLIDELRKAGVNVDIQSLDWATITARRAKKDPPEKGGYNLFMTSQDGIAVTSPMGNVWFNSACDKANPGWACDKTLVQLVDDWAKDPDPAKRHAMIDRIQERAYMSVPYAPAGQYMQPVAFRSNIHGVLKAGVPVYWNIEKK